jgi:hypothetical protein
MLVTQLLLFKIYFQNAEMASLIINRMRKQGKNLAKGFVLMACLMLVACSSTKQLAKPANPIETLAHQTIFSDSNFAPAHVGISIFDPTKNEYLYNYQGDKYFVPASNTKLLTCYAAMKYLGDSLVGLRYQNFSDTAINIFPTGDPTFLHDDYKNQQVLNFLKNEKRKIYLSNTSSYQNRENQFNSLGRGWAWDDYESSYMAERNAFPIHGNVVSIKLKSYEKIGKAGIKLNWDISPNYFTQYLDTVRVMPLKRIVSFEMRDTAKILKSLLSFEVKRDRAGNKLTTSFSESKFYKTEITFATNEMATTINILKNDFLIWRILVSIALFGS